MKVSNCCGAEAWSNSEDYGLWNSEDYGLCPDCGEHCEYIEYCDECGEDLKDCVCEENRSDEKLKQELETDPEITKILEEINQQKPPL